MFNFQDIRNGAKLEINGEPFVVTYFQHVNPGKGSAFVRTKIRSLITGNVIDRTFKAGDKIDSADLEVRHMQFLYKVGTVFHFMDNENYEQMEIEGPAVEEKSKFLLENLQCDLLFHRGKAIDVDLPNHVVVRITHCEPGVKGDTVSNVTKAATVETGGVFQVPLFVEEGEYIRVDTRTGDYLERVKK